MHLTGREADIFLELRAAIARARREFGGDLLEGQALLLDALEEALLQLRWEVLSLFFKRGEVSFFFFFFFFAARFERNPEKKEERKIPV